MLRRGPMALWAEINRYRAFGISRSRSVGPWRSSDSSLTAMMARQVVRYCLATDQSVSPAPTFRRVRDGMAGASVGSS